MEMQLMKGKESMNATLRVVRTFLEECAIPLSVFEEFAKEQGICLPTDFCKEDAEKPPKRPKKTIVVIQS
jgi:hypothetical protein